MRVVVCPGTDGGVSRYRLLYPIGALERLETGLDIDVQHELPLKADEDTRMIVGLADSFDPDIVVFQLPMIYWMPEAIEELQSRGVKVVVEVDDDYEALYPAHRSYYLVSPGHSPLRNWKHLKRCCELADLVTCSTPGLARVYAPHGRVAVLRNYVPEAFLEIPNNSAGVVGWAGATGVHPNDLQVTRGGVAQAVERAGAEFLSLGGSRSARKYLGLHGGLKVVEQPWVNIDLYPYALARMSAGIVPLSNTRFNRGKSWLKGVEYASLGIPFVASGTDEYHGLARYGLGRIAGDRSRDWRREVLDALAEADDVRDHYRSVVREHLTIEGNAWRWAEAWSSVYQPRQRPRRAKEVIFK